MPIGVVFMSIDKKRYQQMANKASPPSPKLKNALKAFLVGGSICCLGQVLFNAYRSLFLLSEDNAKICVSITLIVLTAILTAIGVFDKIAKHAGAGTVVPITGFANAVVAPAMEFNAEGNILGTAANIFKMAGPVIVYGTAAAFIYGIIVYIFKLY